jgi:hypothetical protein
MNSRVEPDVIWGPLSDRQEDRSGVVVDAGIHQAVGSGLDPGQDALGGQGVGEDNLDLLGGLLGRDDVLDPLARNQVFDHRHRHLGPGEVRRVVDPDRVGVVVDPVGEGLAHRTPRPRRSVEKQPLSSQDAPNGRGCDPDCLGVGAPMRQLAMRAVDLAPLVVERHDGRYLVIEQAMRRVAPGPAVAQLAQLTTLGPAVGPYLAELQFPTRSSPAPAGIGGGVEQVK